MPYVPLCRNFSTNAIYWNGMAGSANMIGEIYALARVGSTVGWYTSLGNFNHPVSATVLAWNTDTGQVGWTSGVNISWSGF